MITLPSPLSQATAPLASPMHPRAFPSKLATLYCFYRPHSTVLWRPALRRARGVHCIGTLSQSHPASSYHASSPRNPPRDPWPSGASLSLPLVVLSLSCAPPTPASERRASLLTAEHSRHLPVLFKPRPRTLSLSWPPHYLSHYWETRELLPPLLCKQRPSWSSSSCRCRSS
jgi:hypothetical protein